MSKRGLWVNLRFSGVCIRMNHGFVNTIWKKRPGDLTCTKYGNTFHPNKKKFSQRWKPLPGWISGVKAISGFHQAAS